MSDERLSPTVHSHSSLITHPSSLTTSSLPLIMRKCFVSICHAVSVFLLLHRVAAIVCGVQNLGCQPIHHCLFTAPARIRNNPANRQRATALLMYLDGHLIG